MNNTTPNIDNAMLWAQMKELAQKFDSQTPTYEGGKILVNDAIEKWLDTKRVLGWQDYTYKTHGAKYPKHLKPFFEGMTMLDVTYDTIIDLMKTLKHKNLSNEYIRDTITCIVKPVFKEAYEIRHIIPSNPCTGIKTPKVERVSKTVTATDEDVKALYQIVRNPKTAGHYLWIAIPILAMSGVRRGELLALTWDDVHHDEKTNKWSLTINKEVIGLESGGTLVHRTKTEEGKRTVSIPSLLGNLLMEFKAEIQPKGKTYLLSQSRKDKHMSPRNFHRTFTKWRSKAGINPDITPHSFRRNYATRLFLEHVSVDIVKRQGGWKDDRMPFYYADKAQTEPLQTESAALIGNHWKNTFTSTAE